MDNRYPPRIAAEMERSMAFGCRAMSVWTEDLVAMADRIGKGETTIEQLNSCCHDLMLVVMTLTKTLEIYAPAAGKPLRADAEEIFKRWGEIQRQLEVDQPQTVVGANGKPESQP